MSLVSMSTESETDATARIEAEAKAVSDAAAAVEAEAVKAAEVVVPEATPEVVAETPTVEEVK